MACYRVLIGAAALCALGLADGDRVRGQPADDRTILLPGIEVPEALAWRLRGVVDLPSEALIALSKSAEPIWRKVQQTVGRTLGELLEGTCGKQPPEVEEFLAKQAKELNGVGSLDTVIERGEVAAIPFCLKIERDVTVQVEPEDTPTGILKREYGVSGERTVGDFYAANAENPNYATFEEFESALQVGDDIVVPFRASEQVFVPRIPEQSALPEILAALPSDNLREQVAESLQPATEAVANEFQLNYVGSVEFSDANPAGDCRGASGEMAKPFEVETLKARFAAEEEVKVQFGDGGASATVVGIVDTGLTKVGDTFFDEKFFKFNRDEKFGSAEHDDDDNGHVDDIYGSNFYAKSGVIEPIPTDPARAHGTKMASLILGGPAARTWALDFEPPVVRLIVVNFSNSVGPNPTMSPDTLSSAIDYLERLGSRVINMSLKTTERFTTIRTTIEEKSDVLFVVAAGNNERGAGTNLATHPMVFPARYGGERGEPNVVTVGAHDLSFRRAGFSNFSDKYVDLLAPGCAVETRTDQGTTVPDNGTSPAAAIVSFTAALVRALGLTEPAAIKNRVVLGTDFDPALKDDAWSSGRLNVIKAISLYHDVIQPMASGAPLGFARVDVASREIVFRACADPPIDAPTPDILKKVVPNIGANGGVQMEYWFETDGELQRLSCRQVSGDVELTGVSVEGSGGAPVKLSDVKEIVFSEFPFQ